MKPIVVKDQVRLGPARCLQLALSGMGYRMFRSMVTVSILALAVAFLVHVLCFGLLEQRITVRAWHDLGPLREAGAWVARLTQPDDDAAIFHALVQDRPQRQAEYARFAGADAATMAQGRQDARLLRDFEQYLGNLSDRDRVVLTAGLEALPLLRSMRDAQVYTQFTGRLQSLKLPSPLGSLQKLETLVHQAMPRLDALAGRIKAGQARAIAQVHQDFPGQSPLALLAAPPANLEAQLAQAGYAVDPGALKRLAPLAQAELDKMALARMIQSREVRDLLARQLGTPVALVNQAGVLQWLDRASRAQWLVQMVQDKTGEHPLPPDRLLSIAQTFRRQQSLQAAVGDQTFEDGEDAGMPTGTLWLIALSFLVCVVGVANAMLMSVTERFAEIATMKCLGAMDGFVMMMFLFEAMLQGLFGGLAGIVLGLVLALLRAFAEYGLLTLSVMNGFGWLLLAAGGSLVAGVLLAALAAVWPAYVAARLAPMEAMRVE